MRKIPEDRRLPKLSDWQNSYYKNGYITKSNLINPQQISNSILYRTRKKNNIADVLVFALKTVKSLKEGVSRDKYKQGLSEKDLQSSTEKTNGLT